MHPPWKCQAFRDITPEERERIILNNNMCPVCLLDWKEEVCYAKEPR
jgi:hypothetical protein